MGVGVGENGEGHDAENDFLSLVFFLFFVYVSCKYTKVKQKYGV